MVAYLQRSAVIAFAGKLLPGAPTNNRRRTVGIWVSITPCFCDVGEVEDLRGSDVGGLRRGSHPQRVEMKRTASVRHDFGPVLGSREGEAVFDTRERLQRGVEKIFRIDVSGA